MMATLLLTSLVSAGSIEDLDYKDQPCIICGDRNRQVDDNDVNIDADTVQGVDVVNGINDNTDSINDNSDDINDNAAGINSNNDAIGDNGDLINKNKKTIKSNTKKIKKTNKYIDNHEDDWLKDDAEVTNNYNGGGMSRTGLAWYLIGDRNLFANFETFFEYLETIFVVKETLETTNKRIDRIEARLNVGPEASMREILIEETRIRAERTKSVEQVYDYTCEGFGCYKITKIQVEVEQNEE